MSITRRNVVLTSTFVFLLILIALASRNLGFVTTYSAALHLTSPAGAAPAATPSEPSSAKPAPSHELSTTTSRPAESQEYFHQAFSSKKATALDFPTIKHVCDRIPWEEKEQDRVYLQCGEMFAGLTSIMSQLKVCFKYALDSGSHLVLPSMPLRDSTNLKEFNTENQKAYHEYGEWFDAEHLIETLGQACPKMKIVRIKQLNKDVQVKYDWKVDIGKAPGYRLFTSYYWPGRRFQPFLEDELAKLREEAEKAPAPEHTDGITVVHIHAMFLVYRITDDPTGHDLKLWNEIGSLIRFKEDTRTIVNELLSLIGRPYYGVHFRAENDTIWSSPENQLAVDLDALDQAWAKFGSPDAERPLVYLACGDKGQVKTFVEAGAARGWKVTHKWDVASKSPNKEDLLKRMDALAFDFLGSLDMGVMMMGNFFLGITGSAFSSTVANARDGTGRYRGSSFYLEDDGGARSHLMNDGEADAYPCCL
ncbi:hypothetical protein HYALB_00011219 [Hymenoscyphus albidus]|uniref:Uncharacterized protein n=1 Tax=Hymenoscyphus albidus TaxID=595503 RepID=A0A9N9LMF8_9HELO|nr:hypothetical protein HYALB_00011219 [Hymenoscyphus albidus]